MTASCYIKLKLSPESRQPSSLAPFFPLVLFAEKASRALASTPLLLSLNLLFFTLVTSTSVPCAPDNPKPKHHHKHSHKQPTCPRDTLKLGVCADVLGLVNVVVGSPPTLPCCSLLDGLVDLEAAVCLCTAIKASVLGINLNVPVSLGLVLNACGKKSPSDFQCA